MQPIKLMKFWRQFTVLVQRNLRLILNDKLTMASLILQAPFMVLVIKMVVDPDCFTSNLINIGSRTALFIISAMAAFTAASRIDDFAYTPQQNIAHAMTTFMAQNEGAGKKDRVKDGYRCGMRIEVVYALGLMAVCLIFAEPIIRLFVTDPEVVDLGVRFLRTISLFYLMPAATNGIQGFFRGIGDLRITLISSILNMAGRVAAASVLVLLWKMEIEALPYSYVFGWALMLLYEVPMLVRYLRSHEM